jgi:hypothetical protein
MHFDESVGVCCCSLRMVPGRSGIRQVVVEAWDDEAEMLSVQHAVAGALEAGSSRGSISRGLAS